MKLNNKSSQVQLNYTIKHNLSSKVFWKKSEQTTTPVSFYTLCEDQHSPLKGDSAVKDGDGKKLNPTIFYKQ